MRRLFPLLPLLAACHGPLEYTMDTEPVFGPDMPGEALQAFGVWRQCYPGLRLVDQGGNPIHVVRKLPEDGYADVQGTRVRIPLSPYLRPDVRWRRVPLLAHEDGHRLGIADLDTGDRPALMSKTASALTVTDVDCREFCRIWGCTPSPLPPKAGGPQLAPGGPRFFHPDRIE